MFLTNLNLGVIGLGYVGLPLAVEFGKKRTVVAYDISSERIEELRKGKDRTLEIRDEELLSSSLLEFTNDERDLASCNCYIVAVPTPVDLHKTPDLNLLMSACELIGRYLKKDDLVIFESTVYPGATEEQCVPRLELFSNLVFNKDFYCGYSPERINPGDKKHNIRNIVKVTSGSTPQVADLVDDLYSQIIDVGTYKASSIKVAEAAKVIENTQRDLNIALINELAIIFDRLDIDTSDVLNAASTKWNFLPFQPGLVGGHCIGVDPYYLTYKAQSIGYSPEVILAGRRLNDSMGPYVASRLIKKMNEKEIDLTKARVLILGMAFKEDCNDVRNTKVVDVIDELKEYSITVDVCDPLVDSRKVLKEFDIRIDELPEKPVYDAVILAVAHKEFIELSSEDYKSLLKPNGILFDLKSVLNRDVVDMRL